MAIYWNPNGPAVDPDPEVRGEAAVRCDYYEVWIDGTKVGEPDEPADYGMPSDGKAPKVVRELIADEYHAEVTPGNAPTLNQRAVDIRRDLDKQDFVRGTPP